METLETLKRKTQSAKDLQSVVRTMKTLAAVSIRQYEEAVESLHHYFSTVQTGIAMVRLHMPEIIQEAMTTATGRTGVIVFGSDQGLCGQFNEQVVSYAADSLPANAAADYSFLAVGMRAANGLSDHGFQVDGQVTPPGSASGISQFVQQLLAELEAWRTEHRLEKVLLFYNRRRSASTYRPHEMQLLPIPDDFSGSDQKRWPGRCLPHYTMPSGQLFSALIRQYLFVGLFRACAESLAGENASRIASMQSAERNIGELLTELQTEYNQRRQTTITEELLDVVTGFEVLRDEE